MKTHQEYIRDITEIRTMMERSVRFLSLTGWSGIMAGVYALAGAFVAWRLFFPERETGYLYTAPGQVLTSELPGMFALALVILLLAIGTAVFLSWRKASAKGEKLWNASARRLVVSMAIPLVAGGVFILILLSKGYAGLALPLSLIFYGLALLNASKFTFEEVKFLGISQIILGLFATWFTGYGLLFWAAGFGVLHIVYGIYMQLRCER